MTPEEKQAQSVEAHKDIIKRFIEADDQQLASELAKQHQKQAAPYVEELDNIIARKHQNGFFSQADIKRVGELLPLLDTIEKGEFESTNEGMQQMMADSAKRILERRKEQMEKQRITRDSIF